MNHQIREKCIFGGVIQSLSTRYLLHSRIRKNDDKNVYRFVSKQKNFDVKIQWKWLTLDVLS